MFDVGFSVGDVSSDRCKDAGTIGNIDPYFRGETPIDILLPVDRKPFIRLFSVFDQIATIFPVNDNAPARAEVSHNRITRDGATTAAVSDNHAFRTRYSQRR